ncbi:hypothetical protein SKAU_G00189040, partial [Synaphobranchus kaupii]
PVVTFYCLLYRPLLYHLLSFDCHQMRIYLFLWLLRFILWGCFVQSRTFSQWCVLSRIFSILASIYGNILKVETTGASQQTANQDGPRNPGVSASHALARADLDRVSQYKGIITNVARAHQID